MGSPLQSTMSPVNRVDTHTHTHLDIETGTKIAHFYRLINWKKHNAVILYTLSNIKVYMHTHTQI